MVNQDARSRVDDGTQPTRGAVLGRPAFTPWFLPRYHGLASRKIETYVVGAEVRGDHRCHERRFGFTFNRRVRPSQSSTTGGKSNGFASSTSSSV